MIKGISKASGYLLLLLLLGFWISSCTPEEPQRQVELAIANGNALRIVDANSGESLHDITRYREVMRLAYRPDGQRLAVGICARDRVAELNTTTYEELSVRMQAASCPWAISYSPDGLSLAGNLPVLNDPMGSPFGHLRVVGANPVDRDLGIPLPASAYRPGGQEIAVATPQGLKILSTGVGYPEQDSVDLLAISLAYSRDGKRLIAGIPGGFMVLDALNHYSPIYSEQGMDVIDIAIDPTGLFVALVQKSLVSMRKAENLEQVLAETFTGGSFRDADFSPDGTRVAVAESSDRVRVFSVPDWQELQPIQIAGRIDAIAYRPAQRIPVLFVHGHSGGPDAAWKSPGLPGTTSFKATLEANPSLPIDPFYLSLPLHSRENPDDIRSIRDDAVDILAAIEGGEDSKGITQNGILKMQAYRGIGKVAIVALSQGTLSSRYYLKNLMGSRLKVDITISDFIALAAPNHGVAPCSDSDDRSSREMCAGRESLSSTQCGSCNPERFTKNREKDDTFLEELNGHILPEDCPGFAISNSALEAPRSRPSLPGGVLYANLYAAGNADDVVGGGSLVKIGNLFLDCLGRKLAKNHAPDAKNMEIAGVPGYGFPLAVHANFAHYWPTICVTLRTLIDHQTPTGQDEACQGFNRP